MAGPKDVILSQLQTGQTLVEMATKDLSDAEYFKPAAAGTNHAGWILGHLAVSHDQMLSAITGAAKRLPPATHELFKGGSTCHAEASKYPQRQKIDELYGEMYAMVLEVLKGYDERNWDKAMPEGPDSSFFKTIGAYWGMIAAHPFWHIGQLTTCRVVLKKKPMFG